MSYPPLLPRHSTPRNALTAHLSSLVCFAEWRMNNPFSRQQSLNIALQRRRENIIALFAGGEWRVAPEELRYTMGNGVYCARNEHTVPFGPDKQSLGCGWFVRRFAGTAVHMPNLLATTASTGRKTSRLDTDIPPFCLIMQHPWQTELYEKYHRNGVFLDATHNTNKYALRPWYPIPTRLNLLQLRNKC